MASLALALFAVMFLIVCRDRRRRYRSRRGGHRSHVRVAAVHGRRVVGLVLLVAVGQFVKLKYDYEGTMQRLEAERAQRSTGRPS